MRLICRASELGEAASNCSGVQLNEQSEFGDLWGDEVCADWKVTDGGSASILCDDGIGGGSNSGGHYRPEGSKEGTVDESGVEPVGVWADDPPVMRQPFSECRVDGRNHCKNS